MRKRSLVAVLALVGACGILSGQAKTAPRTAQHAFSSGGHVWMELAAGDYHIRAGAQDRVWVELTTPDPDDVSSLQATIEKKDKDLLVVTKGPRGGMRATIEVPARTDIDIRLSAGDLNVEGLEGNKNISSWAGDVKVDVGSRNAYKRVHASVTAGDLRAEPFDIRKGGLFRSFSWDGPGKYTLDARLTAGDLTLR